MTKSKKETGTIKSIGSGCNGCMPWESPYARIECSDGILRQWWFDDTKINEIKPGMIVKGFVKEATNRLFRVTIA